MQLDTWKGDWGLASVDFESLQVLALANFTKVNFKHVTSNNPFWTPKGNLPVLRDTDNKTMTQMELTDFRSIKNHCFEKGTNIDRTLTQKQLSDIHAYTNLMQQSLEPAIIYTWWLDEKNYVELTRKWFANALPFPFNFYYPGKYEKSARIKIEGLFQDAEINDPGIVNHIFQNAAKCINSISHFLGDNNYIFGNQPSSLDALIYGYLAPTLRAPFLSMALQNHIKGCPNLVRYIERITRTYFSNYFTNSSSSTFNPKNDTSTDSQVVDVDFPHATRNKFLAGIIASITMISYAYFHGLIEVPKDNDDTPDIPQILEDEE